MNHELSHRELSVLTLASRGFTDAMIARELGIEQGTINSYWVRIRSKSGNYSRTELVARFVQRNANADFEQVLGERDTAQTAQSDRQQKLLDAAHAEIEHLKELLRGDNAKTVEAEANEA